MYDFHRQWLTKKFEEIRRRTILALEQLNDEQVNWRPNASSHSIAVLVKHIEGNVAERIRKGIHGEEVARNREEELAGGRPYGRDELTRVIRDGMQVALDTIGGVPDHKLEATQIVRGKARTHLDMLHQCAAHYSEHMGQIFYIAKQILGESYKSTSIS